MAAWQGGLVAATVAVGNPIPSILVVAIDARFAGRPRRYAVGRIGEPCSSGGGPDDSGKKKQHDTYAAR